jgi:GNAT superfamily N-acetyltransferase
MEDLIRRWQVGWGLTRGLGPALEARGALHVQLGLPNRHVEVIALHDDLASLRALATEVADAADANWLTVPTNRPEEVERVLKAAGLELFGETESFMTTDLRQQPLSAPPVPYTASVVEDGSLVDAEVRHPSGEVAAHGTMAVSGADAIAHHIETTAAHRRRGLGSVVMSALTESALALGATTGLLIASPDGQGLYRTLGWTSRAIILTARRPV